MQIFALDCFLLKHQLVKFACKLSNYCNVYVSSQRINIIKSTHYDETRKRAHDLQIVRAKETLNLIHGGHGKRQASTNGLKLCVSAVIHSEA